MNGYRHVMGVESLFQPDPLFRSEAEARAFDRGFACERLGLLQGHAFARALTGQQDERALVEMLRFLADEIDSARWAKMAETTEPAADRV